MSKKLSDLVGIEIPCYPFQAGSRAFEPAERNQYMPTYFLTRHDVSVLEEALGPVADIRRVKAFLRMKCGFASQPEFHWLQWPDLVAAVELALGSRRENPQNGTVGKKYAYQVDWANDPPDGWIDNAEAVRTGVAFGNEYEIYDLKELDARKLNKLLRKPDTGVHFMSTNIGKPGGRVDGSDWIRYLQREKDHQDRAERQVEHRVQKRLMTE